MQPRKVKLRKPSRPLRAECDDIVWFVTTRVTEGRYWLHPLLTAGLRPHNRAGRRLCAHHERHFDKRLAACLEVANEHRGPHQPELSLEEAKRIARGLMGSAVARAQKQHEMQIFGFVSLSNHLHALVRTRGKNLAAFMRDLKSAVTSAINLITGKRGALWERRYDAQPVVDDEGCADRQGYLLDNPTKANLVQQPEHWPGLNLAWGFGDADELDFEYLDRTAWHHAGEPKDLSPFFRTVTLVLSPLPSCEGLSREACRNSVQRFIEQAHAKHEAKQSPEQRAARKPPLGVDKVLFAAFDTRPKPARNKRPYVFGSAAACRAYTEAHVVRVQAYRELSARYRAGERNLQFPEGMYPPPLIQAA
jgi:REP element-mobilizing transposase RayT